MQIRVATLEDIPGYFDHMQRHFAESGNDGDLIFHPVVEYATWKKEEQVARLIADWQLEPPVVGWQKIWVVVDDTGLIVADCLVRSGMMPSTAHRCQFAIGVERIARGQGLGRRLSQLAISWAKRQSGIDWMDLWVLAHNKPAIQLYEQLGFRKVDTVTDQFRVNGQKVDDTHMCLKLSP